MGAEQQEWPWDVEVGDDDPGQREQFEALSEVYASTMRKAEEDKVESRIREEAAGRAFEYVLGLCLAGRMENPEHARHYFLTKYGQEVLSQGRSTQAERTRTANYVRAGSRWWEGRNPADVVDDWSWSVLVLASLRLLSVMGRREHRPTLSEFQQQVVRFYLELDLGIPAMSAGDTELLRTERTDFWRGDLAIARGVRAGAVSEVISKNLEPAIHWAAYFFVLLAPPGRAVVREAEMDPLLDLVFKANEHLPTPTRRLLIAAAEALHSQGDGNLVVDAARLVAPDESPSAVVDLLHDGESAYAARVPFHDNKFRCVLRCDLHRPTEEIL